MGQLQNASLIRKWQGVRGCGQLSLFSCGEDQCCVGAKIFPVVLKLIDYYNLFFIGWRFLPLFKAKVRISKVCDLLFVNTHVFVKNFLEWNHYLQNISSRQNLQNIYIWQYNSR